MTTRTVTTRTITAYDPEEHCDICDLFRPLPTEKAMWDAGGVPAAAFYEKGICISRGSNNDPTQPEKYCRERAIDWRKLALLADEAMRAMRAREACDATLAQTVTAQKPDLDGTMKKIGALSAAGAALEREELAVSAYERARGRL